MGLSRVCAPPGVARRLVQQSRTTTKGKVETFLTYEMEKNGLSHYSLSSSGDMPLESMSLNFIKIIEKFSGMDPGVSGSPETVGYDLTLMKTV